MRRFGVVVMLAMALLLMAGLYFMPGSQVMAQGGTPTPDQFSSDIFMWDGGDLMVVASGGEVEFQSGSTLDVQSGSTFNAGAIVQAQDIENVVLPSVASTAITYGAAAGATGNIFVCGAGEICLIHSVLVNVTANFDATGDDATLVIGDANDADGYIVLADAELQAADTEGTGFAAGWQGLAAATLGAYLDLNHNSFPVVGSTSGYTMTYAVDESSGETLSAGAATVYVTYTRIQ